MTFMDALLKHNRPIWDACIATPFLSELADGSLPPAHFAGYMLQDAIYLNHYARSVGIAIACAQHFDELRLFGELLRAVTDAVAVPVIASGGAGCAEDFVKLFQEIPAVDAGLAASVFHFGEVDIRDLKKLLQEHDITVRL